MENKKTIVEPTILSGFMELLPAEQIVFNRMLDTIKNTYESFGFVPIDTPVIERSDVLLAKSGGDTAKQVYRFNKGDNDLSLRFDLTVPLARFVSMHYGELTFPFRRYHIGKVYRGEKPQKGRFREFYQCDIDIIGNGSLAIINDAEIVSVIYATFKNLGFDDFTIMINNRKLLSGFFANYGVTDATEVLREVDKLDKVGEAVVREQLEKLGMSAEGVDATMKLAALMGKPAEIISTLKTWEIDNETFRTGIEELETVCNAINALGVPEEYFRLNLKIARGLDYYTGTVYETVFNSHPELGSVCSGGRYDELASNYTHQSLPGVGISIGLSRLFYQLNESGMLEEGKRATPTDVLVVPMDDTMEYALRVSTEMRAAGLRVETYLNGGKMGKKLNYANKLGIPYVAVCGGSEAETGTVMLKNMTTGEQENLPASIAALKIKLN